MGIPGVGEREWIDKTLSGYPFQVHKHKSFPNIASELHQLLWLRTAAPISGKKEDLAANLMRAFDSALGTSQFTQRVSGDFRDGDEMLAEWRAAAKSHFLGVLWVDNVENFFPHTKMSKGKTRKSSIEYGGTKGNDDGSIQSLLNLGREWQMPVIYSGTPAGIAKLIECIQSDNRFGECEQHVINRISDFNDEYFDSIFFPTLCKYQWVSKPMPCTSELAKLIVELSGGIQHIMIMLWIAAHRNAFENGRDELTEADFVRASETYLSPLNNAVTAIRSRDKRKIAWFADMLPPSSPLWGGIADKKTDVQS